MAYATSADMIKRYDANRVGQLVKDDGTKATTAALVTDDVLAAALDDASQLLRSAFRAGNRYTDDDITDILASAGAALLIRLTCDIAYGLLMARRGYPEADIQNNTPRYKDAMETIRAIRNGDKVFDIDGDEGEATNVSRVVLSKNLNLVTGAQRLFGDLIDRSNLTPGTAGSRV